MTGFNKVMRFCNTLQDYESAKNQGTITDDLFVVILQDKLAKFKGQTFDWSQNADLTALATKGELEDLAEEIASNERVWAEALNDLNERINEIGTGGGGGGGTSDIVVDAALSTTSINAIQNKAVANALNEKADASALASKQDTLVSGTNIKTVQGQSILGSGNISISVPTVDAALSSTSTNAVQNKVVKAAIDELDKNIGELSEKTTEKILSNVYMAAYTSSDLTASEVLEPSGGTTISATTIRTSDYIPIPYGARILRYNLVANDCLVCFYDSNKTYLGAENGGYIPVTDNSKLEEGEVYLSQYPDAAYFRFNCKIAFIEDCYVAFSDALKQADLEEVKADLEEIKANLGVVKIRYNKDYLTASEVLEPSGGTTISATTIRTSDYIPIPYGARVLQYNLVANDCLVCFYDSNKTYLGAENGGYIPVTDNSKLEEGEVYLSQYPDAAYFRFNCKIAFIEDCYVVISGEANGDGGTLSQIFISARDFGAVGNGITDDTEALEALFNAAYEQKKAVYIPRGVYLIRRSLPIRSNLELYGEGPESIIKRFASVWSEVVSDISEGAETIYVKSVEGFTLGSQFYITNTTDKDNAAARHCTIGIITAIDSAQNSITFRSLYDSIKKGAIKSQAKGCYISTSCAVLRSWSMYYDAVNVKIHDITLDGNRKEGEPKEWFNAPIHFDPDDGSILYGIPYTYASYNHVIRDCHIINSSYDGISEQGSSQCLVDNVTIKNCAMHGLHLGTGFINGKVSNCTIESDGQIGAAIFFCVGVKNVIAHNNTITKYYRGVSDEEYGTEGADAVLIGNIFQYITDAVFNLTMASEDRRGGRLVISNNLVDSVGNSFFRGDHLDGVSICNNVIVYMANTTSPVVQLTQSKNAVVIGNICETPVAKFIDNTDSISIVEGMNCWEEKQQEVVLASYDENDLTFAQVLNASYGTTANAGTIKCSDFIAIPSNATSIKYNLVANDVLICFYKEDQSYLGADFKGYIPVVDKNNLTEGVVDLTQYSDVRYMRFNCKIALMENCYVQLIGTPE